ncbi:MAG: hypothetical protein FWE07_00760 [Turicibacter sp.]|nr:hypothetical protein [Turicibacter sp.]
MNKTYQIFRISLLKLVIGRFLIIIAGVFLPLAFILHVVLDVGMNVSENAQTIIAIPIILLVAAYLNFFLLNYTFEVGNGHVIVSRLSLKGKKIIGQYNAQLISYDLEKCVLGVLLQEFYISSRKRVVRKKVLLMGYQKRK